MLLLKMQADFREIPGSLVASPCLEVSSLLTDAAFLAREKAKADAECYTAIKMAEANKVRNPVGLPVF